jgi:hypothetical protein
MTFDPLNCYMKILDSIGTPTPKIGVHLGVCGLIPHYNKRSPYMPNDFTRFWVNSLVVVNKNYWRSNEFIGLVNKD